MLSKKKYIHATYSDMIALFRAFLLCRRAFFVGKIAVFAIFLHIKCKNERNHYFTNV